MFVTTLRANTLKLIGITVLSFLVVAALIIFVPSYESTMASSGVNYDKVYSNSDRVEFISKFGWTVAYTGGSHGAFVRRHEYDERRHRHEGKQSYADELERICT